jgi:hypothetical protein
MQEDTWVMSIKPLHEQTSIANVSCDILDSTHVLLQIHSCVTAPHSRKSPHEPSTIPVKTITAYLYFPYHLLSRVVLGASIAVIVVRGALYNYQYLYSWSWYKELTFGLE